jgi:hypothetical protein
VCALEKNKVLKENEMKNQLIDKWSLVFAAISFSISFLIVFSTTLEFFGSLFAAGLTAALAWISYVVVRLTILAFKK